MHRRDFPLSLHPSNPHGLSFLYLIYTPYLYLLFSFFLSPFFSSIFLSSFLLFHWASYPSISPNSPSFCLLLFLSLCPFWPSTSGYLLNTTLLYTLMTFHACPLFFSISMTRPERAIYKSQENPMKLISETNKNSVKPIRLKGKWTRYSWYSCVFQINDYIEEK